jgi:hypothetical protein
MCLIRVVALSRIVGGAFVKALRGELRSIRSTGVPTRQCVTITPQNADKERMQTKSLWYIIPGVVSLLLIIGVNLFSQPADAQSPSVSSVVNLASGQESLAPGALAAIFGTNLDFQQPSSVPISVILSGRPVAVLTRSPQELTVQLPVQAQPGLAMLQLALQGFFSSGFPVQLQSFAPGIFTSTGSLV